MGCLLSGVIVRDGVKYQVKGGDDGVVLGKTRRMGTAGGVMGRVGLLTGFVIY